MYYNIEYILIIGIFMLYCKIIEKIKEEILSGTYKDKRLPNRDTLCNRYNVTRNTVQNAIDIIMQAGLLKSHGRNGTEINKNLKKDITIGIAIQSENAKDDSLFQVIESVAQDINTSKSGKFKLYYGILQAPESGDTKQLIQDIDAHVISGLILFWPTKEMFNRFYRNWLPIICTIEDRFYKGCEYLAPNHISLIDKMLNEALRIKRRNVALLTNVKMKKTYIDYFQTAIEQKGLVSCDDWIQGSCLCKKALPWSGKIVELLMKQNFKKKPDVLLVLNESLRDYAVNGIRKAGLHIPRDIEIISHCNFYKNSNKFKKSIYIGFDIQAMVNEYAEMIGNRYLEGKINSRVKVMEAVKADEHKKPSIDFFKPVNS
ncbi:MAG TPA: hypothetical protein DC049_00295 [Spirochaetia bacterium]|nr:hypothetical protein [Spirochaetia bacterium]